MIEVKPAGDRAAVAVLGSSVSEKINSRVMELYETVRQIQRCGELGIIEAVPAFASLLVYYDPMTTDYGQVSALIREQESKINSETSARGKTVEIPVCYGGAWGGDLAYVAAHAGISKEKVIKIHCQTSYRVYMLGFLPGFPYLGGLDERLYTPRLASPRTRIPAGSVGIGGSQTGIYPVESPGGWQLIGRTPLTLFHPSKTMEPLYKAGDYIRFKAIDETEFKAMEEEENRLRNKEQEMKYGIGNRETGPFDNGSGQWAQGICRHGVQGKRSM